MKRCIKSFAKKASKLYKSIHQQLSVYAGAAFVAVVSVLVLAQPSEAKIVYTPVHVDIGEIYNLDLNHDGVTDFTIQNQDIWRSYCDVYDHLFEQSASGNGVVDSEYPLALTKGTLIGHNQQFYVDPGTMASFLLFDPLHCHGGRNGAWVNVTDRYLGLRFQVNGRTHYGWARLNVQLHQDGLCEFRDSCYFSALLTGYAYETIAGKSLKAGQTKEVADDSTNEDLGPRGASLTSPIPHSPQPGSLGMLALGGQGVPLWRRKELVLEGE